MNAEDKQNYQRIRIEIEERLLLLQEIRYRCQHLSVDREENTHNDNNETEYWVEFKCLDCGHRWKSENWS